MSTPTEPFPNTQIEEHAGIRYLYLDSPWIQGALCLHQPERLVHEYAQRMMLWLLFSAPPARMAQCGLGAGALTRFVLHYCPTTELEVFEINPKVIDCAYAHFDIPRHHPRLTITTGCAEQQLRQRPTGHYQVLQLDAYPGEATAPALSGRDFYALCARTLSTDGLLISNFLGQPQQIHQHIHDLNQCFAATAWLPETEDGNLIAISFKQAPEIAFDELYQRATHIEAHYALPARQWVAALEDWMHAS